MSTTSFSQLPSDGERRYDKRWWARKRFLLSTIAIVFLNSLWWCGYESSSTILVKGAPIGVTSDSEYLITATVGTQSRSFLIPQLVPPLRFIHLRSGQERVLEFKLPFTIDSKNGLPYAIYDGKELYYWTINYVTVSKDSRYLAVIWTTPALSNDGSKKGEQYFLSVYDHIQKRNCFERKIAFKIKQPFGDEPIPPVVTLSPTANALAFETIDESIKAVDDSVAIVLWDIESAYEVARFSSATLPAFSLDGQSIATIEYQSSKPRGVEADPLQIAKEVAIS